MRRSPRAGRCKRRRQAYAPINVRDSRIERVSELLQEAAEIHHAVYRIVDGADDDWASWYGDWLVRLSELPEVLGVTLVRSELVYMLVRLDKEYVERKPTEPWEIYYARNLVEHFTTQTGSAARG